MTDAAAGGAGDYVLDVRGLKTHFATREGILKAVDGVDLSIPRGATVGVIGESGCGKSVTAQSVLRIVPHPGKIVAGQMHFRRAGAESVDIAALSSGGPEIRSIRGKEISMIFQEPMASLSPVHTIGSQIMEGVLLHATPDRLLARERTLDMIARVGIPHPSRRIDEYPHQLSGGMRQRAMIAMALACQPQLLIADEPTTALDVTVQAQILDLMERLQAELGMAIMYITHALALVAEIARTVNVMYLGRVVETASAAELFGHPLHPYTRGLLKAVPTVTAPKGTRLEVIQGSVPVPIDSPPRCGFFGRCPVAIPGKCDTKSPALSDLGSGHRVRCFLHGDAVEPGEN